MILNVGKTRAWITRRMSGRAGFWDYRLHVGKGRVVGLQATFEHILSDQRAIDTSVVRSE